MRIRKAAKAGHSRSTRDPIVLPFQDPNEGATGYLGELDPSLPDKIEIGRLRVQQLREAAVKATKALKKAQKEVVKTMYDHRRTRAGQPPSLRKYVRMAHSKIEEQYDVGRELVDKTNLSLLTMFDIFNDDYISCSKIDSLLKEVRPGEDISLDGTEIEGEESATPNLEQSLHRREGKAGNENKATMMGTLDPAVGKAMKKTGRAKAAGVRKSSPVIKAKVAKSAAAITGRTSRRQK